MRFSGTDNGSFAMRRAEDHAFLDQLRAYRADTAPTDRNTVCISALSIVPVGGGIRQPFLNFGMNGKYPHAKGPIQDLGAFVKKLQEVLHDMGIGILRVEEEYLANGRLALTVSEYLDCSGLPELGLRDLHLRRRVYLRPSRVLLR